MKWKVNEKRKKRSMRITGKALNRDVRIDAREQNKWIEVKT